MKSPLLVPVKMLLVFTLITGVVYPALVTGIVRVLFPFQAEGSLVRRNGKIVGSALIAQAFTGDAFFWPRPSAVCYATVPSGAGNGSPTSRRLAAEILERRMKWKSAAAGSGEIPVDLLTASGSGIDPHISPEAARIQLDRIAKARHYSAGQREALEDLMERHTEGRQLGFLGERRVNVLLLNLELEEPGR
jgi:K+-transporting ATPase ATPase C chain